MKKSNFILFFLVSLFTVFISACSSSDDNNGGSQGPCSSPATHVAATYKGFINQNDAVLNVRAINGKRVVATLTYINKKGEEEAKVTEFDVEPNLYCQDLGLDYITQIDGSEASDNYLVLFKYKEENRYIEFFTIESFYGEFPTIIFENGRE